MSRKFYNEGEKVEKLSLDVERRMEAFHGRGKSLCVRCTLLTALLYFLLTFWSFILVSSILRCSSSRLRFCSASRSLLAVSSKPKLVTSFIKKFGVILLPIVPAFLWCALAVAPVPSLQALLMLFDMEEGRLASSPPDRDSKLFCINLSLRPTWSTLSMLRQRKKWEFYTRREKLFFACVGGFLFPVTIILDSPFPGYDRKVFVFPDVQPKNSHVYDYFPISKAIIQVPLVS